MCTLPIRRFLCERGESAVEGEMRETRWGGGHIRDEGRRGRLFSPSRSAVMQGRGYFSRLISTFFYS